MSMRSPLSSPSLRSITHLPRSSYFAASPPSKPSPAMPMGNVGYRHSPQAAAYAHTAVTGSPLTGRDRDRDRDDLYRSPTPTRNQSPRLIPITDSIKPKRPPLPQSQAYTRPGPTSTASTPTSPALRGHTHTHMRESETATRRRPSFKIELPPRPMVAELQGQVQGAAYAGETPYARREQGRTEDTVPNPGYALGSVNADGNKSQYGNYPTGRARADCGARPSTARTINQAEVTHGRAFDLTSMNTELNALSPHEQAYHRHHQHQPQLAQIFYDPFAIPTHQQHRHDIYYKGQQSGTHDESDIEDDHHRYQSENENGGYLILRAPTNPLDALRHSAYPSPTSMPGGGGIEGHGSNLNLDPYAMAGVVGLGYSLNRLRAPTPWIRMEEEDREWLDVRFGGVGGGGDVSGATQGTQGRKEWAEV